MLTVGFLGAFTTFSAFMLETGELVRAALTHLPQKDQMRYKKQCSQK